MLSYETRTTKNGAHPTIQPKLKIGQPGDKYEQEADRFADQVMRMSEDGNVQMQPIEEEEEELQPKLRMQPMEEEEEMMQPMLRMQPIEEEEEMMQPKSDKGGGFASPEIAQQVNSTNGNGRSLSPETNQFMSNAFGGNFSYVNVHTDSKAIQMNQQLGARAFTYGNDIYFNKGEYNPDSSDGNRLLAHELTHVVQQSGRKAKQKKRIQRQKEKTGREKAEDKFKAMVVSLNPKEPKSNSEKFKGGIDKTLGTLGNNKVYDTLYKKLKLNPIGKRILSIVGMGGYSLYSLAKKKIPTLNLNFKLKPETWLTIATGGDFKAPKVMIGLKLRF